jgi:spore coat protein U-like protein
VNPILKTRRCRRTLLIAFACVGVSAHLQASVSCSVTNAALAFPAYETFGSAPTDSIGSVNLNCTNLGPASTPGESVVLKIGAGNGTVTDRRMANGSATLRYGIFADASRSQNWSDGFDAPSKPTGPLAANGSTTLSFPMYGRIQPLQNVPAGSYSDSLLLTVSP